MNKKGFTLLEVLLVFVIIGLVIAIVTPNIGKILERSKIESAKSIEYMLEHNLELYNEQYKDTIWCTESNSSNCLSEGDKDITYNDLITINNGLDLGDCLLKGNGSLKITKSNNNYSYKVGIVCSKDFKDNTNKVATSIDLQNDNIYYESKD